MKQATKTSQQLQHNQLTTRGAQTTNNKILDRDQRRVPLY
jgi:hypothetical protein